MRIEVDELGPAQRKVRVEVSPEAVDNEFSRAYQKLARQVRIKGFRAGKAPRNVLQGIYGDEIKGQVRSQLVEDLLRDVVKDRGLEIVSRPEIETDDLQEGKRFHSRPCSRSNPRSSSENTSVLKSKESSCP